MSKLTRGQSILPSLFWPLSKFTTENVIKSRIPFCSWECHKFILYLLPMCQPGSLADDLSQRAQEEKNITRNAI